MSTSTLASFTASADRASARPTAPPGGRVAVLDGLRGLAIVLVVVHNAACFQTTASSLLLKATYFVHAQGWVGVQLFFVLSGFLITGNLVDARGSRGALRSFWIRRALRIFPLYYAFLFAMTVLAPRLLGVRVAGLEHAGWYWAYLSNWADPAGKSIPAFAHFWSLAVEEQFYLAWPLVVLALESRTLLRACVGIAIASLVSRIALRALGFSGLAVYEITVCRLDALTLGAAAALVARNPEWLARVVPHLRRARLASLAVLVAMWPLTRGFNREGLWVQVVGYGVLSVLFAALVLETATEPRAPLATTLAAPWLRWLGRYSYAMYVFHLPIAFALAPWFAPRMNADAPAEALAAIVVFVLVVSLLSLVGALASWNLLERRMLALKDRLAPIGTAR